MAKKLYHSEQRRILFKKLPKNSVCAELGVLYGQGSQLILSLTQPKKLHLIDPWVFQNHTPLHQETNQRRKVFGQKDLDKMYQDVLVRFNSLIQKEIVKVHRDYSDKTLSSFPDNYFDWVYIDGNHEYAFVKKDLDLCYLKVKPGGFITGDDYIKKPYFEGPIRAVDEFIQSGHVKLIEFIGIQYFLQKI